MVNNDDNNVFIYWVGEEYKIIKFLRSLIYHHSNNGQNYKVHFINYDNLKDYIDIDVIPDCFWELSPMHQSDYLRVQIIYEYGGIWLDSDTIVMDDLSSLFNILKEKEGFLVNEEREKKFISEPGNYLINGIFGSRPKTRFMNEWKNKIDLKLQKKKKLDWTDLGEIILNKIKYQYESFLSSYAILNGRKNIYPIHYDYMMLEFIEKPYENWQNIKREYQPVIILTHDLYEKADHLTESEILEKTPLSHFIKESYSKKY